MLEPLKHVLNTKRIILCSGSPRRKELLSQIGLQFEVIPSSFEENLDKSSFNHPSSYVKENAKQKCLDVWRNLTKDNKNNQPDLIIGADTIVTQDGKIYEKPKDVNDAVEMLSTLQNKKHTVYTGVALLTKQSSNNSELNDNFKIATFHESTDVFIAQLTPEIIKAYCETKEPLDKAGAYGIQGIGATLIASIKGCYFNIVGLPIYSLCKELYDIYTD